MPRWKSRTKGKRRGQHFLDKSLFSSPKYRYIAEMVDFRSMAGAQLASESLLKEFNSAKSRDKKRRIKQATVQASNRALAASKKGDLKPATRKRLKEISEVYARSYGKMELPSKNNPSMKVHEVEQRSETLIQKHEQLRKKYVGYKGNISWEVLEKGGFKFTDDEKIRLRQIAQRDEMIVQTPFGITFLGKKKDGVKAVKSHKKVSSKDMHKRGVWYQEYESARRNVEGIKRDIAKGNLPKNHPALEINKRKMERARKELEKVGKKKTNKTWNTRLRRAHRALRARVGIKHDLFKELSPEGKRSFIAHSAKLGLTTSKKQKGLTQRVNDDLVKTVKEEKIR